MLYFDPDPERVGAFILFKERRVQQIAFRGEKRKLGGRKAGVRNREERRSKPKRRLRMRAKKAERKNREAPRTGSFEEKLQRQWRTAQPLGFNEVKKQFEFARLFHQQRPNMDITATRYFYLVGEPNGILERALSESLEIADNNPARALLKFGPLPDVSGLPRNHQVIFVGLKLNSLYFRRIVPRRLEMTKG